MLVDELIETIEQADPAEGKHKAEYTPLFDNLKGLDLSLADRAVFGIVWRHCQMRDRVCRKSVANMAKQLEIHERQVQLSLRRLCGKDDDAEKRRQEQRHLAGRKRVRLIEDVTPEEVKAKKPPQPRHYRVTDEGLKRLRWMAIEVAEERWPDGGDGVTVSPSMV